VVVPVPVQPASQSTSTTASLRPAEPRESSSPAPDSLRVEHPPSETVHSAFASVADSGPSCFAAAVLSVVLLWPASVVLLAEPVHLPVQSTPASATTSSVDSSSPRSTLLEVPQPPAPSQRAVLLPARLAWSVSSFGSPVEAARAAERSLAEPVLLLLHAPPDVSHLASAPSRSARLD
jgi:hypothetical protein